MLRGDRMPILEPAGRETAQLDVPAAPNRRQGVRRGPAGFVEPIKCERSPSPSSGVGKSADVGAFDDLEVFGLLLNDHAMFGSVFRRARGFRFRSGRFPMVPAKKAL